MDFLRKKQVTAHSTVLSSGKNYRVSKAGVTLIELLVSISIIGIIMATSIYNHQDFVDQMEITNLAYAVALSIREAQVAGVSVRADPESGGTAFSSPYGVYFNISTNPILKGNNKAYAMFIDKDSDGIFDGNFDCTTDECLQKVDIGRGNYVFNICTVGDQPDCNPKGVDISFKRPRPDGTFKLFDNNGSYVTPSGSFQGVSICLVSPKGRKRFIKILITGQISVEKGLTGC